MRKNFGTKSWFYPLPVLVIGTYDENGNPVFKDGQQQFGSSMNPEAERGLLALNAEEL